MSVNSSEIYDAYNDSFGFLSDSYYSDSDGSLGLPDTITKLLENNEAWEYLDEGSYNRAFRTKEPHLFDNMTCVLVRKESFPQKNIYLYHTQRSPFIIQVPGHIYAFSVVDGKLEKVECDKKVLPELKTKIERLFVMTPTAFYYLHFDLDSNKTYDEIVSTDPTKVAEFKAILARDPCDDKDTAPYRLTVSTLTLIKNACTHFDFRRQMSITSDINNKKSRSASLLRTFYPDYPVYHKEDVTLVMPYFSDDPSVEEVIKEMTRLFVEHHRVVNDSAIKKNFKKNDKGAFLIDPDGACDIRAHPSAASLEIWNDIIKAEPEEGGPNGYETFLKRRSSSSQDEAKIVQALRAQYYLLEQIPAQEIDYQYITPSIWELISYYQVHVWPINNLDLKLMGYFNACILQVIKEYRPPLIDSIYYHVIQKFIKNSDAERLKDFLNELSEDENLTQRVLDTFTPNTLLVEAIKTKQYMMVNIILQHYKLVLNDQRISLDALDYAIASSPWTIVGNILDAACQRNSMALLANKSRLWPNPRISKAEIVNAMERLDYRLELRKHINTIEKYASSRKFVGNHLVLVWVKQLRELQREFLLDDTHPLEIRKKIFIQKYEDLLLKRPSGKIENLNNKILLEGTIDKMETQLFSIKPPTSCSIS